MKKLAILFLLFPVYLFSQQTAENKKLSADIEKHYNYLESLYKELHQHPELSMQEKETSGRMASELKSIGYRVIENIGVYGLVGIFENGKGPVILIRTDMDALPIEEETGLSFASKKTAINKDGKDVHVMHACAHDMHMTVFIGTARLLMDLKNKWHGTIVMLAQPAEETGEGSYKMIKDSLFYKIPKPDYILALHVSASLEAGKVGYLPGPMMANVDDIDITVKGKGGHAAYPQNTIDPIVLSARMILDFQTLISREKPAIEPAVLTVGSIHGGTKYNIIPNEVKIQLTLRTYSDDIRTKMIEGIQRISRYLAMSANLPDTMCPLVTLNSLPLKVVNNDIKLTEKMATSFVNIVGNDNVIKITPEMGGEDFGRFGRTKENFPICLFRLGTVSKKNLEESKKNNTPLPALHSSKYAPQMDLSIKTGVKSMVGATLDLFNK